MQVRADAGMLVHVTVFNFASFCFSSSLIHPTIENISMILPVRRRF
jgi:hypothetical protein